MKPLCVGSFLIALALLAPAFAQADGLLQRLPADGTWARFRLLAVVEDQDGVQTKEDGYLTMSSVGVVTENDERCRWIELVYQWDGREGEYDVSKWLIPERRLQKGEIPLDHVKRSWGKMWGKEARLDTDITRNRTGDLHLILAGPLQETKKLTVTVDYEQEQIKAKLADLQRDLLLQAPLASVKLSVEQALADYETFKTSVERNKPSAEVQAKFDSFRQSYKEVTESLPLVRLTPDTTKVDAALTDLAGKVTAFKDSKLTLQSNVDEIAAKINALKEPTRSVHTIELRYESNGKAVPVPAAAEVPTPQKFASGGLASFDGVKAMVAARRYASGGFVGAVPGVGNRDTEFRMLAAGSFVLRKDAVRALVEQRMLGGRLANGVSGNASDGSLAGLIEALNSASVFSRSAPMGAMFDAAFRAQDASIKALRAKFPLGYVEPNAEAFSRSLAQPRVDAVRAEYERARGSSNATAADAATKSAIAIAEGIATPARGLSFDDLKAFAEARAADQAEAKARGEAQKAGMSFEAYLEYIDRLQKEEAAKKAAESSAQPPAQKRADGGSVSGGALIPALLTPGEMVFGPAAVRSIGLGNLELLNAMRFNAGGLVPGALAALASMPPPGIQAMTENLARFNAGGAVTNNNASTSNTNNYGGVSVTINAGGTADARQLARGLVDELNNIARRRK